MVLLLVSQLLFFKSKNRYLIMKLDSQHVRVATTNDIQQMITILSKSFKEDPHMIWILEKSKHKRKFEITLEYQIRAAINSGVALITNDGLGVSLWETEKKEKFTFEYLKRNFFFITRLGIKSTIRAMNDQEISEKYHTADTFFYLSSVGVLPEAQGKGLGSKLMNPVLEYCAENNITIYLETGNPKNVEIYKKKGFVLISTAKQKKLEVYYMQK